MFKFNNKDRKKEQAEQLDKEQALNVLSYSKCMSSLREALKIMPERVAEIDLMQKLNEIHYLTQECMAILAFCDSDSTEYAKKYLDNLDVVISTLDTTKKDLEKYFKKEKI